MNKKQTNINKEIQIKMTNRLKSAKAKAYNTRYSQAVSHPSTNRARRCLTSVIGREPVYSAWYGRRRWNRFIRPFILEYELDPLLMVEGSSIKVEYIKLKTPSVVDHVTAALYIVTTIFRRYMYNAILCLLRFPILLW